MADDPTVRRDVEVDDPELTPRANRLLTDELRQNVGADQVEVPQSVAAAGDGRPGSRPAAMLRNPLFFVTLAAAVMIGVILSLALESWWLVGVATLVHAVLTFVVVGIALTLTGQATRPAPETVARLEAEGVEDPERELNDRLTGLVGPDEQLAVTPAARPTEEAPHGGSLPVALVTMAVVVVAAAIVGGLVHWGAGVAVLLLGAVVAIAAAFVVPTLRTRGFKGDPRPTVDSPGIDEQLSPHDFPPGDPIRRELEARRRRA